jgi:hypothetical protein
MTVVSAAHSEEPKRSNYGAVGSEDAADDVDNAYCADYSLPESPALTDYLLYPYRQAQCIVFNYLSPKLMASTTNTGLRNILLTEYAIILDGNSR